MRDVVPPFIKKVLTVAKLIWCLLSDDWFCFSWMWLYELQPDLLAASSSVTFSWQVRGVSFFIFPQNSCHASYQALLDLLTDDWACLIWMRFYKLHSGLQLQAVRWISLTDRGVFVLHPSHNILTAGKHFWRYWLMTNDVVSGWGHTGCNQVLVASNLVTLTNWQAMLAKLPKKSSSSQGSQAQVVGVVRLK